MQRGFTLVELAIVVLIIGLIAGGIIIGQELIAVAGIRATIGQIEGYNSAVYAFRQKYGGLPGDLERSEAVAFGLFSLDDGMPVPNGNGLIEPRNAAFPNRAFSGEVPVFWRHLSDVGLIDGSFGVLGTSGIYTDGTLASFVTLIEQSIPSARIGRGNFITVYSSSGANYYEVNAITLIAAQGEYNVARPGLLASEAYSIDLKMDDGGAYTGLVVARGHISLLGALNQPPDVTPPVRCTDGLAYATSDTEPVCALRIELGRH